MVEDSQDGKTAKIRELAELWKKEGKAILNDPTRCNQFEQEMNSYDITSQDLDDYLNGPGSLESNADGAGPSGSSR